MVVGRMQSHIEDNTGQTVIMTFKQFIINEPDDITDTSGVQKYQDYKNDVRGQQICEFFTQHKKEEWLVASNAPSYPPTPPPYNDIYTTSLNDRPAIEYYVVVVFVLLNLLIIVN